MSAAANNPDDSLPPLAPGYFVNGDDYAAFVSPHPQVAAGYGLAQNKNGGLYQRRKSYDI